MLDGQFKTNLVVALAGAAVADGVGFFLQAFQLVRLSDVAGYGMTSQLL